MLLSGLGEKPAEFQAAMLRYTFTQETRNIYDSQTLSEDDKKDQTVIIAAMKLFAEGIVNETLERHKIQYQSPRGWRNVPMIS